MIYLLIVELMRDFITAKLNKSLNHFIITLKLCFQTQTNSFNYKSKIFGV